MRLIDGSGRIVDSADEASTCSTVRVGVGALGSSPPSRCSGCRLHTCTPSRSRGCHEILDALTTGAPAPTTTVPVVPGPVGADQAQHQNQDAPRPRSKWRAFATTGPTTWASRDAPDRAAQPDTSPAVARRCVPPAARSTSSAGRVFANHAGPVTRDGYAVPPGGRHRDSRGRALVARLGVPIGFPVECRFVPRHIALSTASVTTPPTSRCTPMRLHHELLPGVRADHDGLRRPPHGASSTTATPPPRPPTRDGTSSRRSGRSSIPTALRQPYTDRIFGPWRNLWKCCGLAEQLQKFGSVAESRTSATSSALAFPLRCRVTDDDVSLTRRNPALR